MHDSVQHTRLRKSSHSGNQGSCVMVGDAGSGGRVILADSKNLVTGHTLIVSRQAFTRAVRRMLLHQCRQQAHQHQAAIEETNRAIAQRYGFA